MLLLDKSTYFNSRYYPMPDTDVRSRDDKFIRVHFRSVDLIEGDCWVTNKLDFVIGCFCDFEFCFDFILYYLFITDLFMYQIMVMSTIIKSKGDSKYCLFF